MTNKQIHISLPSFNTAEYEAIKKPLESGWITQGPQVKKFENNFANYHNTPYSLATTSCTTALHLSLLALDIKAGDEVILPSFTWVATANVVLYCGATPVLVDIDKKTFNIDVNQIKEKITDRTKAIIPVHLFGLPVNIKEIRNIVGKNIKIIEDAACASGAKYDGQYVGTYGDIAAFSFHPRKIITTGEGGMLITSSEEIWNKANILRNHGASISEELRHLGPQPYILPEFNALGFNYRMTDIQAAIGIEQLKKLDGFIAERQHWANYYKEQLSDIKWIKTPYIPKNASHSLQAFVCYIDPNTAPISRNKIMEELQNKGISTRPGTHAVHMLSFYKKQYGYNNEQFPNATNCVNNTIAIPLHNKMVKVDYDYVINAIKEI